MRLNIQTDPNPFKLLTPGPLTTSVTVREQMLTDRCAWGEAYKAEVQDIRARILGLAHASPDAYVTILMQGSGTYGVEAVLSSVPGKDEKVLVLVNGAYSERMCQILARYGINYDRIDCPYTEWPDAEKLDAYLTEHTDIDYVAMVHNETTTGILNPIENIAPIVKKHGAKFIVDCVSSFAAVPIDFPALDIDFAVTSSNKCVQGVPGFSVVIAKIESLEATKGNARTLSLDIYDQWKAFEKTNGRFRYTSPTHVVAAFHQALIELEAETPEKRLERYRTVNRMIREGMSKIGFRPYLDEKVQGPIITTFHVLCEHFDLPHLYKWMAEHGYELFPGYLTPEPTVRVGNIGELYPEDAERIVALFAQYVAERRAARGAACCHNQQQ